MKVLIKSVNPIKCPRCSKFMKPKGFIYRCKRCGYEELTPEGKQFLKS